MPLVTANVVAVAVPVNVGLAFGAYTDNDDVNA